MTKSIVITGASKGIGRAAADALAGQSSDGNRHSALGSAMLSGQGGLLANRKLSRNGTYGKHRNRFFQDTDKSQLATAESARLLIALHSPFAHLETGMRTCSTEKSRVSDPGLSRAVLSLQSSPQSKNDNSLRGGPERMLPRWPESACTRLTLR